MTSNSSNASFHPPPPVYLYPCFHHKSSFFIFVAFSIANVLLILPLCVLVLYLGLQRWRRSTSAASHSDVFTYHMVASEMIGIFGCVFLLCSALVDEHEFLMMGVLFFTAATNGQISFHILTCVERHLAVVHPIFYLGLRKKGGVRIRNVTIGCAWLVLFGLFGVFTSNTSIAVFFVISAVALVAVSYCSLSMLRILIRPGPGEGGGDRERVDRSKMRAFHTITAIMGALLLRFGGHLVVLSIYTSLAVSEEISCGLLFSSAWFSLPSSLVLPLLFLQRAGKLLCCQNNNESKQASE